MIVSFVCKVAPNMPQKSQKLLEFVSARSTAIGLAVIENEREVDAHYHRLRNGKVEYF